jgi:hypothetical protein
LILLPSEAYNVWDSCKAVENSPSDLPLSAADLSEQEAECIRQMMGNAVHYMGRTRFLDKNTRNSRRIEYLIAVFPDALFIHMIRDPRAVVSSFLKVDWWPDLQIWSQNNVTPKQWEKEGRDPAELAAGLWCAESEYILDRIDMLKDRYLQVFYEDLVSEPDSEIRRILDFVGLEWQYNFERFFNSVSIRKENNLKFRRYLSKTQIKVVGDMAAPIMNRLGRSYT